MDGRPAVDEAFTNSGAKVGLEIWRIEKMQVVPVDPNTYGKFYSGDSYIILSTKDKGNDSLEWNIHFWLGLVTSADEAGVAAYKTVELDNMLHGAAVQHREVQSHESKLFQSYFPKGLEYIPGGVDSGFTHVDRDEYEPRLLHVKGRRNVRVRVTRLAWSSLNSGDVFILDKGSTIWVWNGAWAGRLEKIKGLEVARRIRDEERGGSASLEVVEEEELEDESHTFIQHMNEVVEEEGSQQDIQFPTCDTEFERESRDLVKLYRVCDASGALKVTEVGSYPLKMGLLDSQDAFILDTASGSIFVWLGRNATNNEKRAAFQIALDFIDSKNYPIWTHVSRIHESCETPLFKQNFTDWHEDVLLPSFSKSYVTRASREKYDVSSMHTQGQRETQKLVDDGSGTVQIWRIENFEIEEVEPENYGQFNAGDCYIVFYTYGSGSKHIIYFWLGQESTQDERASAAIQAVVLDDEYNGTPVQIRVVQNKEPDHFLLIFKGKMVVHSGGVASGFRNREDEEDNSDSDTRLFQVRGTNDWNCRAVQVKGRASSLNSNDCFILDIPEGLYIWKGQGSSEDEQRLASSMVTVIAEDKEPVHVMEGEEPQEFWEALGGQMEYASGKLLEEVLPSHQPRLFHCSNATGKIKVEEIFDFAQEDLATEDVMILDTYDAVYVWVGRDANEDEKRESLTIATEYIESDPSGREPDSTSILMVKQGFEPVNFTCHFLAWNPDLWSHEESYEKYKESIIAGVTSVAEEVEKYDQDRKYTYEELLESPEGIDVTKKETYLTDEDFRQIMGKTVEEFQAMALWRQRELKKKVGLF